MALLNGLKTFLSQSAPRRELREWAAVHGALIRAAEKYRANPADGWPNENDQLVGLAMTEACCLGGSGVPAGDVLLAAGDVLHATSAEDRMQRLDECLCAMREVQANLEQRVNGGPTLLPRRPSTTEEIS